MKPKTVIVTGGGSSIGLSIAETFLRDGANVVLNGRTQEKLVRAAARFPHPERIALAVGDITRESTAERLIESAVDRFDAEFNVHVRRLSID